MHKLRILRNILHVTGTGKLFFGFFAFLIITTQAIFVIETHANNPDIKTWFDAFYFCMVTVCTVGFGDVVVVTLTGKILTIALMVYGIMMIGLITGIFATFYEELNDRRHRETITTFIDKLERLPELSHEELEKLAKRVKKYKER